ncbi:MAG: DNA-binding response regulator [Chitinophagia bacterium]|nr:DNA-binding response regulator [Chitinophagia bacterium]
MIRTAIIDDDGVFCESIKDYLTLSGKYSVVYCDDTVDIQRLKIVGGLDIIILDIYLGLHNGLNLMDKLLGIYPDVKIIVMTGDINDNNLLIRALKKGAVSFLLKPFSMADLESAISGTLSTGSYLKPEQLTALLDQMNERKTKNLDAVKEKLTKTEFQIFLLTIEGLAYQEIANRLNVSYHTVNYHLKNIYLKTGVNSKIKLIQQYG